MDHIYLFTFSTGNVTARMHRMKERPKPVLLRVSKQSALSAYVCVCLCRVSQNDSLRTTKWKRRGKTSFPFFFSLFHSLQHGCLVYIFFLFLYQSHERGIDSNGHRIIHQPIPRQIFGLSSHRSFSSLN